MVQLTLTILYLPMKDILTRKFVTKINQISKRVVLPLLCWQHALTFSFTLSSEIIVLYVRELCVNCSLSVSSNKTSIYNKAPVKTAADRIKTEVVPRNLYKTPPKAIPNGPANV